jgi:hypothetical protein
MLILIFGVLFCHTKMTRQSTKTPKTRAGSGRQDTQKTHHSNMKNTQRARVKRDNAGIEKTISSNTKAPNKVGDWEGLYREVFTNEQNNKSHP